MWQTVWNWPWVTIWTAISAIFTAGTACVAGCALSRWRKQDELKAKMVFKQSIADYSSSVAAIGLARKNGKPVDREMMSECRDRLIAASHAWLMCEDLLVNHETIKNAWDFIYKYHKSFLNGDCLDELIGVRCVEILEEKFVFK
ncbi:TPA: hypothetical protein ACNV27_002104 [Citrobacter gillenii]|uniref:hypothetical protein n=1 Tax=Citrobacter freundii TaxID=546 RepID=UPI00129CAAF0|nr:hypothetical protein [Citrobacter freundii]